MESDYHVLSLGYEDKTAEGLACMLEPPEKPFNRWDGSESLLKESWLRLQ